MCTMPLLPKVKSLRKRAPSTETPWASHSKRNRLPENVLIVWSSMMAGEHSGFTNTWFCSKAIWMTIFRFSLKQKMIVLIWCFGGMFWRFKRSRVYLDEPPCHWGWPPIAKRESSGTPRQTEPKWSWLTIQRNAICWRKPNFPLLWPAQRIVHPVRQNNRLIRETLKDPSQAQTDRNDDFWKIAVQNGIGVQDTRDEVDHAVGGFLVFTNDGQTIDSQHLWKQKLNQHFT